MNQWLLRDLQVEFDRVEQQVIVGDFQFPKRPLHGDQRSLINVDPIDFVGVAGAHGPGQRTFANPLCQHFAPLRRQRLAVVETANLAIGIQHYGRREYRSEQRATTSFIETRDHPVARLSGGTLVAAGGHSLCYPGVTNVRTRGH